MDSNKNKYWDDQWSSGEIPLHYRGDLRMELLPDNIGLFKQCFSKRWCNEIIEIFDQKILFAEEKRGTPDVYDGGELGIEFRDNKKRKDISTEMSKFGSLHDKEYELKTMLQQCLLVYDQKIWGRHMGRERVDYTGWSWRHIEEIQCKMQRTPPGGGFCEMHYEQGSDYHTSRRFAVWMIYLNDVHKGGTTDFPNQNLKVPPRAGNLLIWPAAYTHPHRSSPDLDEMKYIITGWFVYKDVDDEKNTVPFEKSRFNVI